MEDFTVENLTEEVIKAYSANAVSPRMREIFTSLINHLHGFVKDVALSEAEWFAAITFLTATGKKCDNKRQAFILRSDTLGVSMLVDALNHPKGGASTESTVRGPFFVPGSPDLRFGGDLRRRHLDEALPCLVTRQVTDQAGKTLAGATLEVWQTAANGFYDRQDASAPEWNLRGCLTTNGQGQYAMVTAKPVSYPVPTDGSVGSMVIAGGRHAFRPAHLHFMVKAEGCEPLVTHVFVDGDPYLNSDAVFATKDRLVGEFTTSDDVSEAQRFGLPTPFSRLRFDFGLIRL